MKEVGNCPEALTWKREWETFYPSFCTTETTASLYPHSSSSEAHASDPLVDMVAPHLSPEMTSHPHPSNVHELLIASSRPYYQFRSTRFVSTHNRGLFPAPDPTRRISKQIAACHCEPGANHLIKDFMGAQSLIKSNRKCFYINLCNPPNTWNKVFSAWVECDL